MIGETVDQFHIERLIARGGMAEVYEGKQVSLGRQVAVKVMLPAYAQQEELVSRFQREGRAAARLSHPNIIQIFAIGKTLDGRPYMAMEYCHQGSLDDKLAQAAQQHGHLPVEVGLKIALQIARALSVAHRAEIVHRDLKPGNILFRQDGTAVLADLGIAAVRSATRLTNTGAILGTPHYMSPEQALGRTVDGRSDIYALGVILFQLLAGRRPFEAEQSAAILHQHAYEPPPNLRTLRPGLKPELYRIVDRCLEKEPAKRYQSAAELAAALGRALGVTSPGPVPATRTVADRRRLWLLPLAAIVILALLLVILRRPENDQPSMTVAVDRSVETQATSTSIELQAGPTSTIFMPPTSQATAVQAPTSTATTALRRPAISAGGLLDPVDASADVTALYITDPPLIDGAPDEWASRPGYRSTHLVFRDVDWDGTADLEATWSLAWDEQALFLLALVSDDMHVQIESGRTSYLGDSLELQIDTQPSNRAARATLAVYQIMLSPGNFASLPPGAYRFQGSSSGSYSDAPGHSIQVAAQETMDGYVVEAAIPWTDLGISPRTGQQIGLALNANDNDLPGTAYQEVMISNAPFREWANPSSWGTLTLLGQSPVDDQATVDSTSQIVTSMTFSVDSRLARNFTGQQVAPGQTVELTFRTGEWRAGPAQNWSMVGPYGDPAVLSKATFPVPDAPLMTLIGGVGDAQVFIVGDAHSFVSTVPGQLWLGANDDNFTDNAGVMQVDIVILE